MILVTGGTGFIGSALVRALLQEGHRVRVLTRRPDGHPLLSRPGVEPFVADLTDPASLTGVAEGVEAVFHLAGLLGGKSADPTAYEALHVRGTGHLLEQFAGRFLVRFVHCSTTGVLGPIAHPPADESRPPRPSNLYERTKAAGERLVLERGRQQGTPVTVIRPGMVYGPGDLHHLGLFRAVQRGYFVLIGGGRSTLDPVYVADVVQGLRRALENEQAVGQVYHIAGPRPVTVRELAEAIARALGRPFRPPTVPRPLAFAGAWLMTGLLRPLGVQPPLTPGRVRFLTENRGVSIEKARRELGYEPAYSLEAGLRETVAWYRRHGYL